MKMQAAKIDIRNRDNVSYREWVKQTRIYVWPKGENLMDNLMNRRSRPFAQYKKEVIPAVLEKMGLPTDTKVRWSQYAGCSCPCSPGFIVDGDSRRDVHVDVEEA